MDTDGVIKKRFLLRRIKRAPKNIVIVLKYLMSLTKRNVVQLHDIEEIRGKHNCETVFIVGTAPSLSTYPNNFLDDKISMTIHLAYVKYSNPTYASFTEADRLKWLIVNRPGILNTQIIASSPLFPLVRPQLLLRNVNNTAYVLPYSPKQLPLKKVEDMVISALSGHRIRYQTNGTSLHNAIWSALILGFTSINLIGNDHKAIKGKDYFDSGDEAVENRQYAFDRERTREFFEQAYSLQNLFFEKIRIVSEKHNVTINRYSSYDDYINRS
jgi:hypothetical protein